MAFLYLLNYAVYLCQKLLIFIYVLSWYKQKRRLRKCRLIWPTLYIQWIPCPLATRFLASRPTDIFLVVLQYDLQLHTISHVPWFICALPPPTKFHHQQRKAVSRQNVSRKLYVIVLSAGTSCRTCRINSIDNVTMHRGFRKRNNNGGGMVCHSTSNPGEDSRGRNPLCYENYLVVLLSSWCRSRDT